MEIKKDFRVTEKWHKGFDREIDDITEVIVHHTDGEGTPGGLLDWMYNGEFSKWYKKGIGLFHFCIGKNGSIIQLGDLDRWWWHSDSGSQDEHTIGIELIHKDGDFTPEQYEALSELIFDILMVSCPIDSVVGHDHYYSKHYGHPKPCPTNFFEWERLEEQMDKRGILYSNKNFGYDIARR